MKLAPSSEWLCGIVAYPGYVTDDGEHYRPEALLWVAADTGLVLRVDVGRPGELLGQVVASYASAVAAPMAGPAHSPRSIRVATPELEEALRAALPGLVLRRAPTPELDEIMRAMAQHAEAPPGTMPESSEGLFAAAARFYAAAPWKVVPSDAQVLQVRCEALGLTGVVSVIGLLGESFGFLHFASIEDFDQYLERAEQLRETSPQHLVLNFEHRNEVPADIRKTVKQRGWKVAGPGAWPWAAVIDPALVSRELDGVELARTEAICLGIADLVEHEPQLLRWWAHRRGTRVMRIETSVGPADVEVSMPSNQLEGAAAPEPLEPLFDARGMLDVEAFDDFSGRLLREFAASPDAKALGTPPSFAELWVSFAAEQLGVNVVEAAPHELRAFLLDFVPERVSILAKEAPALVAELRAFTAYLLRVYRTRPAARCLAALDERVERAVVAALGDSSRFGVAKAFVAEGMAAGFDMSSQEGFEAFARASNAQHAPSGGKPKKQSKGRKKKR